MPNSVMFAAFLPPDLAAALAAAAAPLGLAAEPAEELHLTLAILDDAEALAPRAAELARMLGADLAPALGGPIVGQVNGIGRFGPGDDGMTPVYAVVDSPGLAAQRQALVERLLMAGFPVAAEHGYNPHITLGYIPADAPLPDLAPLQLPLALDVLSMAWAGDGRWDTPLGGAPLVAIKAVLGEGGAWELDVLGVPYGGPNRGRDNHGEFFSPRTRLHEDKYPLPPAVYYHGHGPDGKPMGKPAYIGRTVRRWVDQAGIWFKAVLDQSSELARRVWDAAQRQQARASSGSIDHLTRIDKATGEILEWPVVELSIFDIDPAAGRIPANSYAVAVPAAKAIYAAAGIPLPEGAAPPMDEEQIKRLIAESLVSALAAQQQQAQAQAQAQQQEQDRIQAAIKAEREKWEQEQATQRRLPSGGGLYLDGQAPAVKSFGDVDRFDGLGFEDQVYLIAITNSRPGQRASEAAYKAAYIKASEAKDSEAAGAMRAAAKAMGFDLADASSATKANELMHSSQVGYGDEWVGIGYSRQLWLAVRDPARIPGMLPEIVIPQGSESVYDPLEGADPTFYKVPETTGTNATTGRPDATIPASKAGTNRVLHTATKIGGRVLYPGELDENSLIPVAPQLRTQLDTAALEALEHVVIDGDTETGANTNINNIAGTPGSTDLYLSFDGFRKLALVTNTANSRDGGTLSEDDFLETFKLMGTAGLLGADVTKAIAIIDANVRWKILTLAAVKTRDVFLNATIENGELTAVYGYRIYTSYQMHRQSAKRMANTAGKINGTDSSNTTGSILGVRPDQWKLARKRRVTFETSRYPEADANQIVVTMSAGLKYRDTEAAAISYNLTI